MKKYESDLYENGRIGNEINLIGIIQVRSYKMAKLPQSLENIKIDSK